MFVLCQAEDGIRDHCLTGVQTCALPILGFRSLFSIENKERNPMSKILRLAVVTLLLSAFGTPSVAAFSGGVTPMCPQGNGRSEERRVGKECRSRWSPYH